MIKNQWYKIFWSFFPLKCCFVFFLFILLYFAADQGLDRRRMVNWYLKLKKLQNLQLTQQSQQE